MDKEETPAMLLEWNVELSENFALSGTKSAEFDLTAGGDPVVKNVGYTGAEPVNFTASTNITGVTFTVNSDDEKITLTAVASSKAAATAGTPVTFTFTDAKGTTDTFTATVKVTVPVKPAITISGTKVLNVKPGESVKTTLTAGGSISGDISWEIVSVSSGLQAAITDSSDKSANFIISADSTATGGSKNISIKAADTVNGLTSTANLAINVNAPKPENNTSSKPKDLSSSATFTGKNGVSKGEKPFSSLKPGSSDTLTVSLANAGVIAKTWALYINNVVSDTVTISGAVKSAANSWAEITSSSSTEATVEANPPSDLAADSEITIMATDADGNEYTVNLGTVESSAEGTSSIGPSGAGCSAGFGAWTLALAASLFICKKH